MTANGKKSNETPVTARARYGSCGDIQMTKSGYQKQSAVTQKAANSQQAGRPRGSGINGKVKMERILASHGIST